MSVFFPQEASQSRLRRCFLRRTLGFTLVEVLVAISILAVMVAIIAVIGNSTNQVFTQSSRRIEEFQGARNAFEVMTRTISQATLNTYYTVNYAGSVPTSYGRTSDLEIASGSINTTGLSPWGTTAMTGTTPPSQITHAIFFAAPLGYTATTEASAPSYVGLDNLLNVCGFYIQYSQSLSAPTFLPATNASEIAYRFRLMEVLPPTENFPIYNYTSASTPPNAWIKGMWSMAWPTKTTAGCVHQIASNIIALVISPEDPAQVSPISPTVIAPNYDYDSWPNSLVTSQASMTPSPLYQLPPVLHIAMVAIDEKSAVQMGNPTIPPTTLGQYPSGPGLPFTVAANFETDLAALQKTLAAKHINSRVFETRIALRESKWSK